MARGPRCSAPAWRRACCCAWMRRAWPMPSRSRRPRPAAWPSRPIPAARGNTTRARRQAPAYAPRSRRSGASRASWACWSSPGLLDALGGQAREDIARDWGESWDIVTDLAIKLMPGAHPFHATAEAAAEAARAGAVRPESVARIVVSAAVQWTNFRANPIRAIWSTRRTACRISWPRRSPTMASAGTTWTRPAWPTRSSRRCRTRSSSIPIRRRCRIGFRTGTAAR